MSHPELIGKYQTALLFLKTGVDEYNEPVTAEPIELMVRWQNSSRDVRGPNGTTITLDATVTANRDIPIGSQMWLGTLARWVGTGSDGTETELMEVVSRELVPDVKGRATFRSFGLARFRDEPT